MRTDQNIVIVGAGLGGLRTAEQLRRLGHAGRLTLVGEEAHAPYDRPPLSKSLLTQDETPSLPLLRPDAFAEFDRVTGTRAAALGPAQKIIELEDGTRLHYDQLVIATGARARQVPAWNRYNNVHTLRTFDDCLALREDLRRARHVTVVGAGVLGGEIAASSTALGLEVTLVEGQATPLERVLGPALGDAVSLLHRDRGVDLRLSTVVDRIEGGLRAERLVLSTGEVIDTDVVVLAIGSVADTAWLSGSGLAGADGVPCDEHFTTVDPAVHVVGDAASMTPVGGTRPVRLEHWTSAVDAASIVAHNLLAAPGDRRWLTEVPYFWSDQHGVKMQGLGLPDPHDRVEIVAGDVTEHSFLALRSRDGRLTGAFAMGMPAALAKCRRFVAEGAELDEVKAHQPWQPPTKQLT